ncbi:MAG: shikimate kinase [Trichloromonadaceae bacterium]
MREPLGCKSLFLIGFMGAGKSTVAAALSRLTGIECVDLDSLIVQQVGMSIPEIFCHFGEETFRRHEAAALASLADGQSRIVATGGGVVGREDNWTCMGRQGVVVYLQASWEVLIERIGSGEGRPLASGQERERLMNLWQSRLPLYERADLIVNADHKSPEDIAHQILTACANRRSPDEQSR